MILFVWIFVIKQEDKCTSFPVYSFVIEGPELLQKDLYSITNLFITKRKIH